jgi:hypothetical protein
MSKGTTVQTPFAIAEADLRASEFQFIQTLRSDQGEVDVYAFRLEHEVIIRVSLSPMASDSDTLLIDRIEICLSDDSPVLIHGDDGRPLTEEIQQALVWEFLDGEERALDYVTGRRSMSHGACTQTSNLETGVDKSLPSSAPEI